MEIIKLVKVKELPDAAHPDNKPVGYEKTGEIPSEPEVGKQFIVYPNNTSVFITGIVTEIIDKNTFKTKNSVYKIKRLSNEPV